MATRILTPAFRRVIGLAALILGSSNLIAPPIHAGQYAVIGDAGNWTSLARQVRDSILRTEIRKLWMPGDNLYNVGTTYASTWSPWTSTGFVFDVVALGNHYSSYEDEIRFFNMPGATYAATPEPGVRVLVLNSDDDRSGAQQAAWLEKELERATEPLLFVMYHHPSLSLTNDHVWTERPHFQNAVRPLLFRFRSKITAVLNGHDHIATALQFGDLPVIVSGATMQVRRDGPRNDVQERINVQNLWHFDFNPYWLRLTTSPGTGQASATFIRAKDQRESCTIQLRTGLAATLGSNCEATVPLGVHPR